MVIVWYLFLVSFDLVIFYKVVAKMSDEVLCVHSQEFEELRSGKIQSVKAKFYQYELCNDPLNQLKKITPFVVFYRPNSNEVHFIKYKEVPNSSSENCDNKYSVGFGSYVYFKEDIVYTDLTTEDGVDTYIMSLSDLVHTVVKAGKREIMDELGTDILSEFYIEAHMDECFFVDNSSEEVSDKLRVVITMSIDTDIDTFNNIISKGRNSNRGCIDSIGDLSVALDSYEKVSNDRDLQSTSVDCINHILARFTSAVSN